METNWIKDACEKLQTKEDVLQLLNQVKLADLKDKGLVDRYYPFSMKQLNYYCNPNNAKGRYKCFEIPKKTGGRRKITAPRNRSFKSILQCLNIILKTIYTPSDYAMGFTSHRSVVTNAELHIGQNYVFNTDLKDFFPSIEQPRIWKRLQLTPFNFNITVANIFAGLSCMKSKSKTDDKEIIRYNLPQGSPTSPIITNMICDTLDRRLSGLAKRFGLNYSRYADDITFSSMHNVYKENGEFMCELRRIISSQNFLINEKKTRLQKKGSKQEVTGIIVCEKKNVANNYTRDIRNILYIWDRYGFNVASIKFNNFHSQKKRCKGNNIILAISGKLQYLKMVKGEDDSCYLRLSQKFQNLKTKTFDMKYVSPSGSVCLQSQPLETFEGDNKVHVEFSRSELGHPYAFYMYNQKKQLISIGKGIKQSSEIDKANLKISTFMDKNGLIFNILDQKDSISHTYHKKVTLEELDNLLDAILQK